MRVGRNGKGFTLEELKALAETLKELEMARRKLMNQLNGRVKVEWLDPLSTGGKAHRWYDKLRSALDDDWCEQMEGDHSTKSPFYGWRE
jgi:hypothetical protein